jgi:O-antigen/teichoic acid export membrane protein
MNSDRSLPTILFVRLSAALPNVLLYITSTGSLLIGQAAQFLGFIVLARYLGAEQFGGLMLITAATSIALSISGLGTEEVMLRRSVQEPMIYARLLGHSLIVVACSGLILTLFVTAYLKLQTQAIAIEALSTRTLLIFSFSNIVLAAWIILAEVIFLAQSQFMYANFINSGFAILRSLTAILACVFFGVDRLEVWAFWHGGVYVMASIACIAILRRYGGAEWCVSREEIWRGIHVATMQLITALRQNVDRLVLSSVVTAATLGAYSVAANIVKFSLVMPLSFSRLFYPKLVRAGLNGVPATLRLATTYLPVILSIGVATSIGLFIISPLLPLLFGPEYQSSSYYLMILCWLPILIAAQNIAYDALGAAEQHGVRSLVYNSTGVAGVGLVVVLTHLYGIKGTLFSLFLVQAVLSASTWLLLIALGRKNVKAVMNPATDPDLMVDHIASRRGH